MHIIIMYIMHIIQQKTVFHETWECLEYKRANIHVFWSRREL